MIAPINRILQIELYILGMSMHKLRNWLIRQEWYHSHLHFTRNRTQFTFVS